LREVDAMAVCMMPMEIIGRAPR